MTVINRQITLASRPVGFPEVSDFHLVYSPLPSPADGEVLVRAVYLSLDPGLRERMSDARSDTGTVGIGEVVSGGAVAFVVESLDPAFRAGDTVEGTLGWQEFAVAPGRELRKIDPTLAPISTALGVLGLPGLTAFFGLLDIADPQPGETVVVSEAAGPVGMIVGQIAKIKGCRVVGVTGSDTQTSWLLDELGFDAAFNCRTVADCCSALEELCPAGIDIYFDSDGGTVTDAVMQLINSRARISVCGQISQYNLTDARDRPALVGPAHRQAGKGAGVPDLRLCRAVPRGPRATGHMVEAGEAEVPGGYRPRHRGRTAGLHPDAAGEKPGQATGAAVGAVADRGRTAGSLETNRAAGI